MKIKDNKVYINGYTYDIEYYRGSILQYKNRINIIKRILDKI